MDKMKKKKYIVFALVLVLLAGVFFGYEKYRVKPLFDVVPLSRSDIVGGEVRYLDRSHTELDPQQVETLCKLLDGASVKFWSRSKQGLPNFYASAILYTEGLQFEIELKFSTDGHIAIDDFGGGYLPTYTLLHGGDAIYQYLSKLEE